MFYREFLFYGMDLCDEMSAQSPPSYPCMLPPSPSAPQSFEPSSYPSPHLPGPPNGNTSTGKILLSLLPVNNYLELNKNVTFPANMGQRRD